MSETNLPSRYDPKAVESKWYDVWEARGYFHAEPNSKRADTGPNSGDVYCITIPPPNVTGSLHMGHAFNHSVQDLLIRWNRMRGKVTLCVPGTDHASIAVHAKLEQQLATEGQTRHDLGRATFLERAWAWKEHYGGTIIRQLRTLGCSYDWRRERFTMDEHYTRAVQKVFVEWFRRGWIYRGYRIINWCTQCQTSLSDLEAPMIEQPGKLWHIKYPVLSSSRSQRHDQIDLADESFITVATTRPETMLGDTAVAVNAKDDRYTRLIGKTVLLPLMNREIPIVADDMVDPSFGTGAVKVTPAHDASDFDLGQRHNLPQVLVIGQDALMTAEAKQYAGLDRWQARERVVRDLDAQGLLVRVEDYPEAKVPRCARCDSVLEPLPLEQWFVSMKPMAHRAIEVVEAGKVRYVPQRYTAIALEWLRNIRDWNISRQLWWGQRIPAWQCRECVGSLAGLLGGSTATQPPDHPATRRAWIVQLDPPASCPQCGSANLEQDPDVFDTWFSSGIWPQTVLGWPDDTAELKTFFPTSLLSTGRDILHLWVARMIMSSLDFCNDIPFHDVYIHPTILNWEGKRMSKSLGTGVDPLDLIDEYGADATRFGLLYMCSTTQDVRFTEERIEMARNFCNKVWNASRFVLMNLGDAAPLAAQWAPRAPGLTLDPAGLGLAERWILSRLARTIGAVTEALERYEFDVAARALYEFMWSEFCDWYLELAKPALREDSLARVGARQVLATTLEATLRLLQPFMPFISEEIWQRLTARDDTSVMTQAWPQAESWWFDDSAEAQVDLFIDTVRAVRNLRAEAGVPPGKPVSATLICHSNAASSVMCAMQHQFASLDTRATVTIVSAPSFSEGVLVTPAAIVVAGSSVMISVAAQMPQNTLSASTGEVDVHLSLAGLADVQQIERLTKECDRLREYIAKLDERLADEKFTSRAPARVIDGERSRRQAASQQLARTEERLMALSG